MTKPQQIAARCLLVALLVASLLVFLGAWFASTFVIEAVGNEKEFLAHRWQPFVVAAFLTAAGFLAATVISFRSSRVGTALLASVGAAAVLLTAGHSWMQARSDLRPELTRALSRFSVPAGFTESGTPAYRSGSDPSLRRVWTAVGPASTRCASLDAALHAWSSRQVFGLDSTSAQSCSLTTTYGTWDVELYYEAAGGYVLTLKAY